MSFCIALTAMTSLQRSITVMLFSKEEAEAQRAYIICLRLHSWEEMLLSLNPDLCKPVCYPAGLQCLLYWECPTDLGSHWGVGVGNSVHPCPLCPKVAF